MKSRIKTNFECIYVLPVPLSLFAVPTSRPFRFPPNLLDLSTPLSVLSLAVPLDLRAPSLPFLFIPPLIHLAMSTLPIPFPFSCSLSPLHSVFHIPNSHLSIFAHDSHFSLLNRFRVFALCLFSAPSLPPHFLSFHTLLPSLTYLTQKRIAAFLVSQLFVLWTLIPTE